LYIHGTVDPIVPFEGIPGLFSSARTTTAFWADQFDCSGGSITTDLPDLVVSDNSTVTLTDYKGCDAGTEVLFYQVNNGGHTWPGGGTPTAPAPLGPVNRDIDASAEIWEFFARNPHPGTVQVCHAPPGNPANARTITVSINALPAHLAHGDSEGPCDESS
jgi:polyhydroxybutyrate depolymerase